MKSSLVKPETESALRAIHSRYGIPAFLFFFFILTLFACKPTIDDSDTSPEGRTARAHRLLEDDRTEEALTLFRELQNEHPTHRNLAEWKLGEALSLLSLERYYEALNEVSIALDLSTSPLVTGRALLLQTELMIIDGNYNLALEILKEISLEILSSTDAERATELAQTSTSQVSGEDLIRSRQEYPGGWLELFLLLELESRAAASNDYEHALLYGFELDRLFPSARETYGRPELYTPEKPFIALLMPLTGEGSNWGQDVVEGAELAVDRFADTYANSPVLVVLDTQGEPDRCADFMLSLADNASCIGVLGPLTSAETMAAGEIAHREKIPLLSPTATSSEVDRIGSFVHRLVISSGNEAAAIAEYAVNRAGITKFGIIHPFTAEAVAEAEQFTATVEMLGARVVVVEGYESGVTHFRDQIRAVKAYSPQGIFLPVSAWDVIQIAPQLRFYSLDVSIFGTSGLDDEIVPRLGDEYVEGAIFTVSFDSSSLYPPTARFSYLFQRYYNKNPSIEAAQGYDAANIFLKAWEANPHTRTSIENFLSNLRTYDGVLGIVSLGITDLPRTSYPLVTIEDGEIVGIDW